MSRRKSKHQSPDKGPSQRQLRAGELIRHALVEILQREELYDGPLRGAMITISEVRLSPDLRHATVFVEPLGGRDLGGSDIEDMIDSLNRSAKFIRGKLGRKIETKFTPDLKFLHDESYDYAAKMDALFLSEDVKRDLDADKDHDPSPGNNET